MTCSGLSGLRGLRVLIGGFHDLFRRARLLAAGHRHVEHPLRDREHRRLLRQRFGTEESGEQQLPLSRPEVHAALDPGLRCPRRQRLTRPLRPGRGVGHPQRRPSSDLVVGDCHMRSRRPQKPARVEHPNIAESASTLDRRVHQVALDRQDDRRALPIQQTGFRTL